MRPARRAAACSLSARKPARKQDLIAATIALAFAAPASQAYAQEAEPEEQSGETQGDETKRPTSKASSEKVVEFDTLHVDAQSIGRQALGSSVITSDDLERRPPANDLSEILRTMPGVNLTGNSSSGQYGNNRQIDLRGMGPENTLVLIDGKQVGSRDSVRMGRSGERNTRGDTNWVPAEAIERIEVLRGPAAARYGSGASGGVINIITKKPGGKFSGSVTGYAMQPEHSAEAGSRRIGFQVSGPLAKDLAYRVFGNYNKTDADSLELNADYAASEGATPPAGREGVENKDINGLLRWDPVKGQVFEVEGGFSRQGNIYAGDRAVSGTGSDILTELANAGAETNRMYRRFGSVTHRGEFDFGSSRLTLTYENTDNTRLREGLAGGGEGSINTEAEFVTSELENLDLDGSLNLPFNVGGNAQITTLGIEARDSKLNDPFSMSQGNTGGGGVPGLGTEPRSGKADMQTTAAFVEHNAYFGALIITPGLRFDHNSQFGGNLSPSLNAQYAITPTVTVKGGVARAFKAPNLYQSNPNYLYYTMGNGCPPAYSGGGNTGGCYVQGNDDLNAEKSLNKEIGLEYAPGNGFHTSGTYFHNDYKDKIVAGLEPVGYTSGTGWILQWTNAPKAVVQGFEGNINIPLLGQQGDKLKWLNNVTYMIENKNKSTNQPLSVIPEYTVNTTFDLKLSARWSALVYGQFYGKQESATMGTSGGAQELDVLDPYNIWGFSGRFSLTPKIHYGIGVNNIFDERLFREGTNAGSGGAATYNEPGRSYFITTTIGF